MYSYVDQKIAYVDQIAVYTQSFLIPILQSTHLRVVQPFLEFAYEAPPTCFLYPLVLFLPDGQPAAGQFQHF